MLRAWFGEVERQDAIPELGSQIGPPQLCNLMADQGDFVGQVREGITLIHHDLPAPALWNAVETRKNSQVASEIRVALPAELDHGQRVELVRDFCQRQLVDRGMVADISLHAPRRKGDDRNHHTHILLTTREIAVEGFTG